MNAVPRALVLGGRGFLGGHVCRALLDRGYQVRVGSSSGAPLANLADLPSAQRPRLEVAVADPARPETLAAALDGCRVLINSSLLLPMYTLGWQRHWPRLRAELASLHRATREARVDKVIFMSVSGTFGGQGRAVVDERTPYQPRSVRTVLHMKYLAEQEVLAEAARGLPVTVVNPSLCFGPHDTKPSSAQYLLRFLTLPFRALDHTPINVVDVRDMALATVSAIERGQVGERYLLTGHNLVLGDLVGAFRRLAGYGGLPRLKLPTPLLILTGVLSELLGRLLRHPQPALPLIGIDVMRFGLEHYASDKAAAALGFRTRPFDETLRDTYAWLLQQGMLPVARSR